MNIAEKLAALRRLMKEFQIEAYLVPSTDAHQNEYVPLFWRRREWISGFTGSAGDVIVTDSAAALWTDGRYYLQAESQLSGSELILMKVGQMETPTFAQWLSKQLKRGGKVGVDPRVLSMTQFRRLKQDLHDFGQTLVAVEDNLVDRLWSDRPAPPSDIIHTHPVKYAGESFPEKLGRVREAMKTVGATAHVVAALDSVAWLFNIRGSDIDHVPVVIAYAIVGEKTAYLYTDPDKVTADLRGNLGAAVQTHPYDEFRADLLRMVKNGGRFWVDPASTSPWIAELIAQGGEVFEKESPIPVMKAMKNLIEVRGSRSAHVRDGVAMVKFLCWLETVIRKDKVTELSIADKLDEFRRQNMLYVGTSFDSIVGYAGHGAIIHYAPTKESNARLKPKGLLIVDSGGQYLDGTTDITRTLCLGEPTAQQREQFTRVLKGHIALATASFPSGTHGKQLDTLARKALWDAGLNYDHGTGHGVGSYLSVHEGPQSISPTRDTGVAMQLGMICSNEPGYYRAGAYGIRIENLVCVIKDKLRSTRERAFLAFETLTLCPIDLHLVDKRLMTKEEVNWLNEYHARVRKTLTPRLGKIEAAWLAKATRPI